MPPQNPSTAPGCAVGFTQFQDFSGSGDKRVRISQRFRNHDWRKILFAFEVFQQFWIFGGIELIREIGTDFNHFIRIAPGQ